MEDSCKCKKTIANLQLSLVVPNRYTIVLKTWDYVRKHEDKEKKILDYQDSSTPFYKYLTFNFGLAFIVNRLDGSTD